MPVYKLKPAADFLQPILIVATITQTAASATLTLKTSNINTMLYMVAKRLLQGCVYEDGLADTADASGVRSKRIKLTAIKDAKTGVFGALALALLLTTEHAVLRRLDKTKAIKATAVSNLVGYFSML